MNQTKLIKFQKLFHVHFCFGLNFENRFFCDNFLLYFSLTKSMTRYSRKKGNCAPNRSIGKRCLKTKHYKKDTDQILEEIRRNIVDPEQKRPFEMVDNLPAQGKIFCIECE